ncbi:uncharacterized protein LOC125479265 [Pyrus x bretschneideri]|uniref:uncharacterized protein LOC125479265 n=1 Tax=Pyrus x bretschneideri TaxID=225117 RepID=UPI002030CFB2|nr:uncharacterized protein LOC125479265 [Pyrus x bretschneideri]XP_048444378.1 uncharacterized protein LOC125479265 [Pyrus x bretschneideri]XP_048444379.1 uncharacterized protein LOC125479265 [Pyrus x bretschneideri]
MDTAMADKPSRALVLYGDGLARFVDPSYTHLHSLASKASCGFLSLPIAPPSESEDERIVREFAVLLDAYEEERGKKSVIPISERFMGMKAAIFTNNSSLKSFGTKLGLSMFQIDGFLKNSPAGAEQPVDFGASKLLKLLGFQEGKAAESSQYELVFVHVGAGEVEYLNALVGGISQIDQPGSEVSSRLHLSVVLSFGKVSENEDTNLSVSIRRDDENSKLSKIVPRQSYTVKGENPREDVRDHCSAAICRNPQEHGRDILV